MPRNSSIGDDGERRPPPVPPTRLLGVLLLVACVAVLAALDASPALVASCTPLVAAIGLLMRPRKANDPGDQDGQGNQSASPGAPDPDGHAPQSAQLVAASDVGDR